MLRRASLWTPLHLDSVTSSHRPRFFRYRPVRIALQLRRHDRFSAHSQSQHRLTTSRKVSSTATTTIIVCISFVLCLHPQGSSSSSRSPAQPHRARANQQRARSRFALALASSALALERQSRYFFPRSRHRHPKASLLCAFSNQRLPCDRFNSLSRSGYKM